VPREHSVAFAPGRVNLIGEHTDYNQGLALPFAIAEGVTVTAEAVHRDSPDGPRISAHACDLGEQDEFSVAAPQPAPGWRAFVRGIVAELGRAGFPPVGARLQISGDVTRGAGLSSSAALEVALCLALVELEVNDTSAQESLDRVAIAQLCGRVESEWVGAKTGLLDQLASLFGAPDTALCIDFRSLEVEPVPLRLSGWRLVVLDSGESHLNASSGYNERRADCVEACRLLGVGSLREASAGAVAGLPEPLCRRARHVLIENDHVREAVTALRADDLQTLGELLNASQASLRQNFEVSTPAVEAAVERLLGAGAVGARVIGGGFGGSVLGLFEPDAQPPAGAHEVRPSAGAHLLAA
jgi:galactokinase